MSCVMVQAAHSMTEPAPQAASPTPGCCVVPRCEMRFEKTRSGCKIFCVCDDEAAVATLRQMCQMLAGQCCTLCCTMNGMSVLKCSLCCCHCSCEPTEDGCCITCQTGDAACCEVVQRCCEAIASCIENGCCCTICLGATPICCCC